MDFKQLKGLKLEGWHGPFFNIQGTENLNQENMTHDVKPDEMETIRLVVPSWCGRTGPMIAGVEWTGLIFAIKDGFVQVFIPKKRNLSCAVFFQGLTNESQISHYLREIAESFPKFPEWHRRVESPGSDKHADTTK